MNTVLNKIKCFIGKVRGLLPRSLPVGMTAFTKWSNNIISVYGMPDNDSSRFVLSVLIQQAPFAKCRYSDAYFANRFWKGASNQVAAQVIQDLKEKPAEIAAETAKAKAAAEAAAQAAATLPPTATAVSTTEATVTPTVAPSGQA